MTDPSSPDRLNQLRHWRRVRPDADLSLGFVQDQFNRQVAKPFKQLAAITKVWQEFVPVELIRHTRLDGLNRGVLHVSVNSSSRLYQLDRLLRGGLQEQIIIAHKGPALRRVKLSVANF